VCAIYSLRLASVIVKVSEELGKTIKKDSNASDLPACKEKPDVWMSVQLYSDNNFHLRRALFPSRPAIT